MNGILRSQTRTWFHCKTVDVIVQSYIYNLNFFFFLCCNSMYQPPDPKSGVFQSFVWVVMDGHGQFGHQVVAFCKTFFEKNLLTHELFNKVSMYVCMHVCIYEWMNVCMHVWKYASFHGECYSCMHGNTYMYVWVKAYATSDLWFYLCIAFIYFFCKWKYFCVRLWVSTWTLRTSALQCETLFLKWLGP